jgi:hypothetical protein
MFAMWFKKTPSIRFGEPLFSRLTFIRPKPEVFVDLSLSTKMSHLWCFVKTSLFGIHHFKFIFLVVSTGFVVMCDFGQMRGRQIFRPYRCKICGKKLWGIYSLCGLKKI